MKHLFSQQRGELSPGLIFLLLLTSLAGFGSFQPQKQHQDDTTRTNEAMQIIVAANMVVSDNNGALPTGFDRTGVKGVEYHAAHQLTAFAQASFAEGAQDDLRQDAVRLVVRARCDGDRVVSGSSRAMVVQYTLKKGSQYESRCLES